MYHIYQMMPVIMDLQQLSIARAGLPCTDAEGQVPGACQKLNDPQVHPDEAAVSVRMWRCELGPPTPAHLLGRGLPLGLPKSRYDPVWLEDGIPECLQKWWLSGFEKSCKVGTPLWFFVAQYLGKATKMKGHFNPSRNHGKRFPMLLT